METLPALLMYILDLVTFNEGKVFNTHWIPLKCHKIDFDVQSCGLFKVFLHKNSHLITSGHPICHG